MTLGPPRKNMSGKLEMSVFPPQKEKRRFGFAGATIHLYLGTVVFSAALFYASASLIHSKKREENAAAEFSTENPGLLF